jgi:hypothetical protein
MVYTIFSIEIAELVLLIATAVAVVTMYLRTRNVGFVWLGGAAVLWPILSSLLRMHVQGQAIRALRGEAVGSVPLIGHPDITYGALLEALSISGTVIATILMLIAILYLGRRPHKTREGT